MDNDFFVTSEAIWQYFSRVTKSRVKIIAESTHEWQKNRYSPVFEIVLGTLVDIRSTNVTTFGGPALILVDQRKMQ